VVSFYAHWIDPQRAARPTVGNPAIAEIERRSVPRAEQASCRQVSETEIGLFVRAYPFARHRAAFVPDHDQIDSRDARTDNRLRDQLTKPADRYPLSLGGDRGHLVPFIHQDRPFARVRFRSSRRRPRRERSGHLPVNRRGRTSRAPQTHSVRPAEPSFRHRGCHG